MGDWYSFIDRTGRDLSLRVQGFEGIAWGGLLEG